MQHGCALLHEHTPFAGHELPSQQCSPKVSLHGLPTTTQQPNVSLQFMPKQQEEKLPETLVKLHRLVPGTVESQHVPLRLAHICGAVQQLDTVPSLLVHTVWLMPEQLDCTHLLSMHSNPSAQQGPFTKSLGQYWLTGVVGQHKEAFICTEGGVHTHVLVGCIQLQSEGQQVVLQATGRLSGQELHEPEVALHT